MEAERAGHDVEALVGEWQCLGGSADEVERSSGLAGGVQHPRRSVEAEECQLRPFLSQELEQAPGASADIEELSGGKSAGERGRYCSLDRAEEHDLHRGTVVGPGPDIEVQLVTRVA